MKEILFSFKRIYFPQFGHMNANFPGVKFFRTVSNFKKDAPAVLFFSSSLLIKTKSKAFGQGHPTSIFG